MTSPQEINRHLQEVCEELNSKYAIYPIAYERWYGFDELVDGEHKVFLASPTDQGVKMVQCLCLSDLHPVLYTPHSRRNGD